MEKRYEAISSFIVVSELRKYNPDIFLQGSFKLGTAIKPLTQDGSFDIDIVCCLNNLCKKDITQAYLKNMTGRVIKDYVQRNGFREKEKDGRRCWTIKYVDTHNFHIDILPCLLEKSTGIIEITDKNHPNYEFICDDWAISNPKGYAEWFENISKFNHYKKQLAYEKRVKVEDIPYYSVRTPLQRVVQLLKRHAEVSFENEMEYKPSSVIITTLAAKAYSQLLNVDDFFVLLQEIANKLVDNVDYLYGKPCVLNPINSEENLSIKWEDSDEYYKKFVDWIEYLKFDLSVESGIRSKKEKINLLKWSMQRKSIPADLTRTLTYLPYHKKYEWRENFWKKVEIKATVFQKKFRPKKLLNGQPVGKNADIVFEVCSENANLYDIYWQVTNTGTEAEKAKQLRGDFYDSDIIEGKKKRKESTQYYGMHYVEAFLVKDGICVGRSNPFMVNIVRGAIVY